MAATAVIQTQIDGAVRDEAAAVLASMGLAVSGAVRQMLTRLATEHALPVDPLIPNAETVEAMLDSRRGKLQSFDTVEDLMADLILVYRKPDAELVQLIRLGSHVELGL